MPELYKPFPSEAKNKKYSVWVKKGTKKTLIHFGDRRYKQYRDKLGTYSSQDHNDKSKRAAYYKRFGRTSDKNTARYWSGRVLW